MHYGRWIVRATGLRHICDDLSTVDGLETYVAYLRARDSGDRRRALSILPEFIAEATSWPFERRRDFVDRVCALKLQTLAQQGLIPYPLEISVVLPTLEEWIRREPTHPAPFRWRSRDVDDLRRAIQLDPNEQIARRLLIACHSYRLSFAVHELPEGYCGQLDTDLTLVDEINAVAAGLPEVEASPIIQHAEEFRAVIELCLEYRRNGGGMRLTHWWAAEGRAIRVPPDRYEYYVYTPV